MEEGTIIRKICTFNNKIRLESFSHRSISEKCMKKKFFVMLIALLVIFNNKKVCGQVEVSNTENVKTNLIVNQNIEAVSNTFAVDNNVYKMLEQDGVMLWSSNSDEVVVKNNISYNGNTFKVKYIYEKAFEKNSNIKNIIIEKGVLGFCDSYGNLVKDSTSIFKDKQKLTDADLGEIECDLRERCFLDCNGLVNLKISKNIKSLGGHTFERCSSLNSIDLSEIKTIRGNSSFELCRELSDIGEFNDELEELPSRTFFKCGNLNIKNLKNITKLGDECFKSCRHLNKDAVIKVEEIGEGCFWDCNFSEVYLKEAKKIYKNAFGGMESLKKVRFGAPVIPFLEKDISMGSAVNEWIYPKEYINQEGYLLFLSKLEVSKAKWYPNFDNSNYETTQGVKLNSLKFPKSIIRPGYEIEGWYKEPECIHKVNMIADLGEINDSDIVIKNPELYAKWTEIKEDQQKSDEKSIEEENETDKPKEEESEKDKSKEAEDAIKQDKIDENNDDNEQTENEKNNDIEQQKQTEEKNTVEQSKEQQLEKDEKKETEETKTEELPEQNNSNKSKREKSKGNNKHKSKKRRNLRRKNVISKEEINEKNFSNKIKAINIINNNEKKEIELKKCSSSTLDYKMAERSLTQLLKQYNNIDVYSISYNDMNNHNMKICKSGLLGEITDDYQLSCIYLKSNDCFEKDSYIEIEFKNNTNLYKLYLYNEEMKKFLLINDNLEVKNNLARIKPMDKKEYIITNFDLNKEEIINEGWNNINNDWYYIRNDGSLAVNSIIDGHTVGNDGKLV